MRSLLSLLLRSFLAALRFPLQATSGSRLRNALILVSNLLPMAGVFFLDWSVFSLLFLFWWDSLLLGLLHAIAMILSAFGGKDPIRFGEAGRSFFALLFDAFEAVAKLLLVPFFLVNFSLFLGFYGGLILLFGIFTNDLPFAVPKIDFHQGMPWDWIRAPLLDWIQGLFASPWTFVTSLPLALLAALIAQAVAFQRGFIAPRKFRSTLPRDFMLAPYRRIFLFQGIIALGVGLLAFFDVPAALAGALFAGKAFLEIRYPDPFFSPEAR